MRSFIRRAIEKLPKLPPDQVRGLILELASENELLEMVLDSIPDGIMVADSSGLVVLFNKGAERLLTFSVADPYEKEIHTVIKDPEISSFVRESLKNPEKTNEREFTLGSTGASRTLFCSVLPLLRDGSIQGSVFSIKDVTEKRSREARLRRAENLASLTNLAAGVAHEIKNPLGSIGIHIQLIQKALRHEKKINKESIEHYLDVMNEEVERLNAIIVDFLFAVRPMNAEPTIQSLNGIVQELIEFVSPELEEAGIRLKLELNEELPRLLLDDKYVKQALLNLIKNSIAAMPDGGLLTIKTGIDGPYVYVEVNDTGIGIPEENMGKIFEPYFTTKSFGSGLGLTVVYKIVKEHGGDITVKSKEGSGSSFILHFPIPQEELKLLMEKKNEV
ncbi:MAG TPA: ATP-binding protein [Spirochaetia bacterium]|nr:ATP-binding protein [Spirochaetia bacterium]